MSEDQYLLFWAIYLGATAISFLFFCSMTKGIKNWPNSVLLIRLLFLAVMLPPVALYDHTGIFSPAVVVFIFDSLQGREGAIDAGMALAIGVLLAVLIISVRAIWRFFRK